MKVLIMMICLLFCSGCDGYIRTLYLLKPGDPKPSWTMSNKVISIRGNESIPELVRQVANDLDLKQNDADRWYWSEATSGHGRFSMELKKSEKDVWIVLLLDWPTPSRSDKSKAAEDQINRLLKVQPSAQTVTGR